MVRSCRLARGDQDGQLRCQQGHPGPLGHVGCPEGWASMLRDGSCRGSGGICRSRSTQRRCRCLASILRHLDPHGGGRLKRHRLRGTGRRPPHCRGSPPLASGGAPPGRLQCRAFPRPRAEAHPPCCLPPVSSPGASAQWAVSELGLYGHNESFEHLGALALLPCSTSRLHGGSMLSRARDTN